MARRTGRVQWAAVAAVFVAGCITNGSRAAKQWSKLRSQDDNRYLAAFGAVHPSTLWLDLAKFASDSHELTITPLTSRNGAGTAAEGIVVQAPTAAGSLAGLPRQVSMDLDAPDGFALVGVRVCYQLTNPRSTISRIRVSRPGERGKEPQILIDDTADRTAPGPVCVDTRPIRTTEHGPITVTLRFSLQDPLDRIALRGVGLLVE